MTKIKVFFAIGVLFIGGVFWVQRSEHAAIDTCLDAGNRWDHDQNRCDG